MSSRVTGAGLALIAVALLAVSVATPAVLPAQLSLFAGHPTVANHTRGAQDVYVGLYSAQLCNSGGDGTCKSGDATLGFRLSGYAELALTGGLALLAVTLSLLTLRRSEGRKAVARLVWLVGGLAVAAAAALVLQGPFHEASIPIGVGMALHGAGIFGAMIAGIIAGRPPPPIRLRVADRASQPHAALPTAQAFDRRAMRDGGMRPGDLGTDSRLGFEVRTRPPPQPFDAEPASDPFAPPPPPGSGDRPNLPPASQLRPLYDAAPFHGGTGGLLPVERPVLPAHPPAPVARAAQGAHVAPHGVPVPPMPMYATDEPHAAMRPFADDEPHATAPPFADDASRMQPPPFAAGEPRPQPHVVAGELWAPQPPPVPIDMRPTVQHAAADESHAIPPPFADEPRQTAPRFSGDLRQPALPFGGGDPRQAAPRFPGGEARTATPPPPPPPRSRSPSMPPQAPTAVVTAVVASPAPPSPPMFQVHGAQAGHKPRTQVSLVPPMPDIDPPIEPPAPQFAPDGAAAHAAAASSDEPTQFARPEAPLAPLPVPPPPGPRARSDSQLPPPLRGSQLPKPPLRAAVPMPARSGRATASPTQPPGPTQAGSAQSSGSIQLPGQPLPAGSIPPGSTPPGPNRLPSPTQPPSPSTLRGVPLRPTISTSVPPIPAIPSIPAIPPIPPSRRAETDVTERGGPSDASGDLDAATVSRVPIEVGEYDSQTNVSVDLPHPDDDPRGPRNAGGAGDAGYVPDTSPSGEPVAPRHARGPSAASAVDQPTILGAAVIAASRPTIQIPGQQPDPPPPGASPPLSRTVTPQARDRMPRLPISTAPDTLPPPKDNKQTIGPSPACPQCESPMAWIEEHLRFYCKSCRMYF